MKSIFLLFLFPSLLFAKTLRVMVIDTGVDYRIEAIGKYINKKYKIPENMDGHGHGTHVAGSITMGICPEVEIIPCKYTDDDTEGSMAIEIKCIQEAINTGVDIVNYSSSGLDSSILEQQIIKNFAKNGIFVTAAGNNGINLDLVGIKKQINLNPQADRKPLTLKQGAYPALYGKGNAQIHVVGNLSIDKFNLITLNPASNYAPWLYFEIGSKVLSYAIGGEMKELSGTSMAAAVHTNKLIKKWCKREKL